MVMTSDPHALPRGRHARTGGPGPHQWLAAPAFGDHRRDRLPPQDPGWHVAGQEESALLQPPPPDEPRPVRRPIRHRPVLMAVLVALACFIGTSAGTIIAASAAHASTESVGARMLDWAEVHARGHPYQTGGTGPYVYDCSGTVYAAAKALGISLPRTSFGMAAGSPHLEIIPLRDAERGDILVYPGAGHVEFKTIFRNGSFGAAHHGTVVWWHTWSGYWHPVFALRVHLPREGPEPGQAPRRGQPARQFAPSSRSRRFSCA
jgi:hypothetical protein